MRRLLHFYTSWSAMEDSECESPPPLYLGPPLLCMQHINQFAHSVMSQPSRRRVC